MKEASNRGLYDKKQLQNSTLEYSRKDYSQINIKQDNLELYGT